MEYELIRSGRKTLAVEVVRGGGVLVRAPYRTSVDRIEKFISDNRERIERAVKKAELATPSYGAHDTESEHLRELARDLIPCKVGHFAEIMGVEPKGVKITAARKRFGSCSSKGTLCFSLNLMQYPGEVIDYVVVHELAHLKFFDHSKEFWNFVEKYIPDYKSLRAMLRK